MNRFSVDSKITFGNILTSLTIIGSVIAALISWQKDRLLTQEKQANEIRAAASATLTKLDRWKAISLSTFDEVKPLFVDTKEDIGHHHDIEEAKHTLWKNILKAEIAENGSILDEDFASGYTGLSSYDPDARVSALNLLKRLNAEQTQAYHDLLTNTQEILDGLETAHLSQSCFKANESGLYNSLVLDITEPMRSKYEERLENILKPSEDALTRLVKSPTPALLSGSAKPGIIDSPLPREIEPLLPKDVHGHLKAPRNELNDLINKCNK